MKEYQRLILPLLVLSLVSCQSGTKTSNSYGHGAYPNPNGGGSTASIYRNTSNRTLGLAALQSFYSSPTKKNVKNANLYKDEEGTSAVETSAGSAEASSGYVEPGLVTTTYSYPFNAIKINDSKKYYFHVENSFNVDGYEEIFDACGKGDLECIIADFTTYTDDTTSNMLVADVTDTLVTIKGELGWYTILSNTYKNDKGVSYTIFSSHKQLKDNEITKDFEPPIYSILVGSDSSSSYIQFAKSDNVAHEGDFFDSKKFIFDDKCDYGVDFEVKTLMELNYTTEVSLNVEIDKIETFYYVIKPIEGYNLERIAMDTYTKFENDMKATEFYDYIVANQISTLTITYDIYYEGHNPKLVYANSIVTNVPPTEDKEES